MEIIHIRNQHWISIKRKKPTVMLVLRKLWTKKKKILDSNLRHLQRNHLNNNLRNFRNQDKNHHQQQQQQIKFRNLLQMILEIIHKEMINSNKFKIRDEIYQMKKMMYLVFHNQKSIQYQLKQMHHQPMQMSSSVSNQS